MCFFFFKQKTAYDVRISDWSSDVCSSDLRNLWHYDEDIRSRPLYANHIDADVLINLHTNASTNAAANGTRAFVARNRPYDLELANNILCGMKELIHVQAAYKNFNVANQAVIAGNYGENNRARMPSVVLEVGFQI